MLCPCNYPFRRETAVFESAIQASNPYQLTLDDIIASRGSIPLIEGEKIMGAVGCSGATGSQDEIVCGADATLVKQSAGLLSSGIQWGQAPTNFRGV